MSASMESSREKDTPLCLIGFNVIYYYYELIDPGKIMTTNLEWAIGSFEGCTERETIFLDKGCEQLNMLHDNIDVSAENAM